MSACGSCGHDNTAGAKFCIECGCPMVRTCPTCATAVTASQKFCAECGHDLRGAAPAPAVVGAPPPPAESERKQVTVLFADVVRSMDLAEQFDPDEWTQIITGLFTAAAEAVQRFGGTVDKFTGDGLMALFGAPIAQEDHATRAAHAALALTAAAAAYAAEVRIAHGAELAVRVGLNSGEVVAGAVGASAFTAVGHTVGLAQRLESIADPGTIRLSEHTAALMGEAFLLRALGKTELKGSSAPVGVFALDAASGGSAAPGRRRSGAARFVGRDSELATLEAALTAAQGGRAQVVGIVGEAGAGKSRLCEELAQRATELGVIVRRTAGVSHAQSVPLLPIVGLLQNYVGVTPEDEPAEIRRKAAERFLSLDSDLESELALIFDFLEVPDPDRPPPQLGPEARRRRMLDVLRRATHKRSERATLVLILEDLHWFDPQSVAFLEAWIPTFPGTRTLVVTNFRPEFHAPWMGHSFYRQLPLPPLDDPAVGQLLAELLGPGAGLSDFAAQLRSRAGGNPFFAEEMVRGLAADGTLSGESGNYQLARPSTEVRVPATVQAVLAARIDRLVPGEKSVLQSAAVIGRVFHEAILRLVTALGPDELNAALQSLRAAELLQETGTLGEYRFWHPLTQEVTYHSLLANARRRRHAAVAAALIEHAPERHDEFAALIATHFEAAGDDLETARWQFRASQRAIRTDVNEANRRLHNAAEHLADMDPTPESQRLQVRTLALLVRTGVRIGITEAEADRLVAQARILADQLGDPGGQAMLALATGAYEFFSGDAAAGRDRMLEGRRYADESGAPGIRAWGYCSAAIPFASTGPVADGLASVENGIAMCSEDVTFGIEDAGYCLYDYGHMILFLSCLPAGRLKEARRVALATKGFFEQRSVADWQCWALSLLAQLADLTGEGADRALAHEVRDETLRLASESGSMLSTVKALHAAGLGDLLEGRPDQALQNFGAALTTVAERRAGMIDRAYILACSARAHLALDDRAAARAAAAEAVAIAREHRAPIMEAHAHAVRARILRKTAGHPQDLAEAGAAVEAGMSLAAKTGAATHTAFLAEEAARLEADVGARHLGLKLAAEGYAAIGATGHARRVREEVDR
ncbi:MAG TPA: adenylate/guanylate cyclase domain-containing protein [Sporichthya sp.]|nr:adenylate/guanylate cyclase domain-containing protein [Sporichthya sp.]